MCKLPLFLIIFSVSANVPQSARWKSLSRYQKIIASTVSAVMVSVSGDHHIAMAEQLQPTDKDNNIVKMAFRDFDLKRLDESDKEFTLGLNRWKELERPRDEIVLLLKGRASVRVDNKHFAGKS